MAGGLELSISSLAAQYASGKTPKDVVTQLYEKWSAQSAAFIYLVPLETLLARCDELANQNAASRGPLWGIPFAVKDNIDVQSFPTTAACPKFEYTAEANASCVEELERAGGIMVGKTNMDQFACGLVGTRTPYGTASCSFDSRFIPGGSSSGSASLVGGGLVSFALGTDTAGSGRVPAMFNGCVGVKPTIGLVSTKGVVPACLSLDCVSVFATCTQDGASVVEVMSKNADRLSDPTQRIAPMPNLECPPLEKFRFAIPGPEFLDFGSCAGSAVAKEFDRLFAEAIAMLTKLGGEQISIDFKAFSETASLLYGGAFVAERLSGVDDFLMEKATTTEVGLTREDILKDDRMTAVTRAIFAGGVRYSAKDLFNDFAKLSELKAKARVEMEKFDVMLVPTTPAHYMAREIMSEEVPDGQPPKWSQNANLGRFTNFVNMMDMCGIALPSGKYTHPPPEKGEENLPRYSLLQAEGGESNPVLPFGITLLAPAWTDQWLWKLATKFQEAAGLGCGPMGH